MEFGIVDFFKKAGLKLIRIGNPFSDCYKPGCFGREEMGQEDFSIA
jgi:hypothetical protein